MNIVSILLVIFSFSANNAHDFHISKCLIKYNEASTSLEISLHIFIDDFEEALESYGAKDLNLCTEKESDTAEDYMIEYLSLQFHIKQNGILLEPYFLGKEISDDLAAVWCYFEIPDIQAEGELEIKNEILLDMFNDQKNITSVKLLSVSEYFLFHKGKSIEKIKF